MSNSKSRPSREFLLSRLTAWQAAHAEIETQYDALQALTGLSPESPLATVLFSTFTQYTQTLAELIGDTECWLDWYQYECAMGAKPMLVQFTDGKQIQVNSLSRLVQVMRYQPKKTAAPLV